jgi:aspartate/tyrosine/aromatic aminotransferase
LERYPYYEASSRGVAFERMLEHFGRLPSGSIVLLHACCHNPTGADLDAGQWGALAGVIESRGLVPFVDLAYQGFGDDLETDVQGLRLLATRVPQLLLALSCSKNFGLYRERAGALAVIAENATVAGAIATHQARTARRMYSMPPDHGAAIVARLLGDPALRAAWESELAAMVARMKALRVLLAGHLAARRPGRDFSWVTRHRGMFSLTGLDSGAIDDLRSTHHVYVPPDGRINIAGVSDANVDRVADSLVAVMG